MLVEGFPKLKRITGMYFSSNRTDRIVEIPLTLYERNKELKERMKEIGSSDDVIEWS